MPRRRTYPLFGDLDISDLIFNDLWREWFTQRKADNFIMERRIARMKQTMDSPVAQLSFTTSTKPALLSGRPAVDAEADEAYKYLIMPVRLSG